MGLALNLHNQVTVTRLEARGEQPPHPMVAELATLFFSQPEVLEQPFGFEWSIQGEVPRSRGLGSSVTVRLGVLMGLNALASSPLNKQRLFEVCTEAEGHPDNVGPAVFGGFVLANGTKSFRFEVQPKLKTVLLIPDHEVETAHARAALPSAIPHKDAARNTANACNIVASFANGDYESMSGALEDFLHQPYRQHLIPGLFEAIDGGVARGAIGGYLSGSGSTIACFSTQEDSQGIADAMKAALAAKGITGKTVIADADNIGARILN